MTKNRGANAAGILLITCLLLQGCSPSEEELWGLGSFVFLMFVCLLVLNGLVPRIQEIPNIQMLVIKLERLAEKVLPTLLIMAVVLIAYGTYSIAINEDRSRQDLLVFVGAVILFMAVNVRSWARTHETLRKRNHLRMIGLSVSFLVVFGYLLIGAPNISL